MARQHERDGKDDRPVRTGRVKDAARDGRLKENKDRGVSLGTNERRNDVRQGGRGRVKNPAQDGRLKGNRAKLTRH